MVCADFSCADSYFLILLRPYSYFEDGDLLGRDLTFFTLFASLTHNQGTFAKIPPFIARHFRHKVTDFSTFTLPTRALKPLL